MFMATAAEHITVITAQTVSTFSAEIRLMMALPITRATMNRLRAPKESTRVAVEVDIQPLSTA